MSDNFESVMISGFTLSPEDGADATLALLDELSDQMPPYRWGQLNADDLVSSEGSEFTLGCKVVIDGNPALFTVTFAGDLWIYIQPVVQSPSYTAMIAIARTACRAMGLRLAE